LLTLIQRKHVKFTSNPRNLCELCGWTFIYEIST